MKRVMFIGQAMPRVKRDPHDWPSLNRWLFQIGFDNKLMKKWTEFSALVDYFPGAIKGSHIVPSQEEIEVERPRLKRSIANFEPELVVPIGKLSIEYCLREKVKSLADHIGEKYSVDPYGLYGQTVTIIPLPHPSGASTWKYKTEHMQKLRQALELLKGELF